MLNFKIGIVKITLGKFISHIILNLKVQGFMSTTEFLSTTKIPFTQCIPLKPSLGILPTILFYKFIDRKRFLSYIIQDLNEQICATLPLSLAKQHQRRVPRIPRHNILMVTM